VTKIAGIPEDLQSLARALQDVAPEIEKTSNTLSTVSLPEMPPNVAGVVMGTLGSVGQKLNSAAVTVREQGLDVGRRAVWLRIAGEGGRLMTVYPPTLGDPWESPQMPDFGPGPELPGGPQLPDFGPGPDLPDQPGLPDYGPRPGIPGMPGFPDVPGMPGLPDYGPLPGDGLPGVGLPGLPGFPGLPGHGGDDEPDFGPLPIPTLPDFNRPFPGIAQSNDGEGDGGGSGSGEGDGDGDGKGADEPIFIPIPVGRWPDADETVRQGEEEGNTAEGEVDREGARDRRRGRFGPEDREPGKDIDEWPPAVIKPDKDGVTLRPTDPHDNRGMGAYIGNKLRGIPDGSRVRIGHEP
jgi:hypothetical protein